jgi:putative FmdB family regulatory protein
MPIYEYECSKCGQQTEVWQKFSDPPMTKCKMCRGKMKKLISHNTFHLKGSGWYVTDYATKDGTSKGKSEEKPKTEASKTPKDKPEKKKAAASTAD